MQTLEHIFLGAIQISILAWVMEKEVKNKLFMLDSLTVMQPTKIKWNRIM